MCPDHKLQADDAVSCSFGASSLSSMLTLTATASLLQLGFSQCKNNQTFNKRKRQSACSKTKEIYIKKIGITIYTEIDARCIIVLPSENR